MALAERGGFPWPDRAQAQHVPQHQRPGDLPEEGQLNKRRPDGEALPPLGPPGGPRERGGPPPLPAPATGHVRRRRPPLPAAAVPGRGDAARREQRFEPGPREQQQAAVAHRTPVRCGPNSDKYRPSVTPAPLFLFFFFKLEILRGVNPAGRSETQGMTS